MNDHPGLEWVCLADVPLLSNEEYTAELHKRATTSRSYRYSEIHRVRNYPMAYAYLGLSWADFHRVDSDTWESKYGLFHVVADVDSEGCSVRKILVRKAVSSSGSRPGRRALSPKKRFSIMQRDDFRCQYCGATARDAQLVVDHVIPVSRGGSDNADNLVTACDECNSGKSDSVIT